LYVKELGCEAKQLFVLFQVPDFGLIEHNDSLSKNSKLTFLGFNKKNYRKIIL